MSPPNVLITKPMPITGPLIDDFQLAEKMALLVVGDVHGQHTALKAILTGLGAINTHGLNRTLVFLGDLIDRGLDSLGCLKTAFDNAAEHANADTVVFLPGNHELMFLDVISAVMFGKYSRIRDKLVSRWLENGGFSVLSEASAGGTNYIDIDDSIKRVIDRLPTLGDRPFWEVVPTWPSHYRSGDALCVHAGIIPNRRQDEILSRPQSGHGDDPAHHWSWIREPFLKHECGWPLDDNPGKGALILHGHSVALGATSLSMVRTRDVAAAFNLLYKHARVNLDGGAAMGIGVAAALLTQESLRLLFCPINSSR